MSFIEDNDLHAEYAIGVCERFQIAQKYSNIELAEILIAEQKYIDEKFKKMTLDIAKKVISMEEISTSQRNTLEKAYVYNFEIEGEY